MDRVMPRGDRVGKLRRCLNGSAHSGGGQKSGGRIFRGKGKKVGRKQIVNMALM